MSLKYVGKGVTRVDAASKVTGQALYVADIRVPRMLHAKVVRAGVPHAVIKCIDVARAQAMPGVRKVVTGEGCEVLFGTCLWDQPPLAVGKVRHAGEAVAVVLAETVYQAEQGAKAVKVEYEALPYVLDPEESASPGAPVIHEKNGDYRRVEYVVHPEKGTNIFHRYKLRKGDVELGFGKAQVVLEQEFEFPLSNHAALEPHGAICRWGQDGRVEVWASNQAPFVLRDVLSDMFGIPAARIRVHIPYLGGGFGGKSDVSIEPMVAWCARAVPGYAVKLVLTRKEVFTSSLLGRGMKGRMKLGAMKDGTLVAMEARMYFSDGAYGDTGWPVVTVAGHNCTGPYEIPNCKVDACGVYTNSPPVGAYRGYGHPEGQFMMGRMMDLLARELGQAPSDLMRKNYLCEGKVNSIGQVIKPSHGDLFACLDNVEKALLANEKPADDEEYLYGRGIASMMKSPKMAANAASCAYLSVNADGSVFVNLSGIEMGQGVQTVFAQMAAEALQVSMDAVQVYTDVDTQLSPWEWQTVASMQTYRGGRAIQQAASRAIEIARHNAALAWGCDVKHVEYKAGECCKVDSGEYLCLRVLARGHMRANGLTVGVPIQAVGSYKVDGLTEPDPETGMGNAAGSWTFGVQGADIRICRKSGKVEVLHFASCFDPGKVVNPTLCRGQIVGGVVQGMGAALMEKLEFKDGVVTGANFGPYKIPTVEDMPRKLTVDFVETPNSEGPWSAKPIAEHPIVAVAPALLNAIQDATGVDFFSLPVTPDRILAALAGQEVQS